MIKPIPSFLSLSLSPTLKNSHLSYNNNNGLLMMSNYSGVCFTQIMKNGFSFIVNSNIYTIKWNHVMET